MGRTTDEIRKRIDKREEKLGRDLSKEEIRKITKSVKRKVARENLIRGTFLAMGITIGAGGHALLTSGENKENNKNNQQAEEQIDINTKNTFKDDIKVYVSPIIIDQNEQIRNDVEQEIESLESKEEILNYIKDIYITEYNKQNNENFTIDQLNFRKSREEQKLHKDTAINGDSIIRTGYERDNYVDTEKGVITAYIKSEEETIKQQIVNYGADYRTIYSENEEVDKYEDNFLVSMGALVDAGIDWSVAIDKEENSKETQKLYEKRFIDSVVEYKVEQMEETKESKEQLEEPEI